MSKIRSKDSKPEMKLRRLIHGMGFRYRLHVKDLPGCPDMVFKSRKSVIFLHGCFWHRHEGCKLARIPKSKVDFWLKKLESNRKRDILVREKLQQDGWRVLVVWECQLKDIKTLQMVEDFLTKEDQKERHEGG